MEAALEVCPNCGSYGTLKEATGWCHNCSVALGLCECGNPVEPNKKLCYQCKYDKFLADNADALENYTAQGLSLEQAKIQVLKDNKPYCLCCHEPIARAGRNVFFCTRYARCRTAKRRYRTLRGYHERDIALQLAVQEVHTLREELTTNYD